MLKRSKQRPEWLGKALTVEITVKKILETISHKRYNKVRKGDEMERTLYHGSQIILEKPEYGKVQETMIMGEGSTVPRK